MMRDFFICLSLLFFTFGCDKKESKVRSLPVTTIPVLTANTSEVQMNEKGQVIHRASGELFTGVLKELAEDGGLLAEINFKDGVRHGLAREWHDSGEMALQGKWDNGVPIGIISEWLEDGLIRRNTTYQGGQIIKRVEEPSEKADYKVNEIVEERKKLNQTVWQDEEQAQQFEATFVELWDQLREKDHDWNVFGLFPFESIRLGHNPKTSKYDWGIEKTTMEFGGRELTWNDWKKRLNDWEEEYILKESEWHQESFSLDKGKKNYSSLYKIVLHLQKREGKERVIVRGAIDVVWSDKKAGGLFLPKEIIVKHLTLWKREGAIPFQRAKVFDPTIDAVNHRYINPSGSDDLQVAPLLVYDLNGDHLPEVILAGANLVYWNQGGLKFKPEPLVAGSRYAFQSAVMADFNGDGFSDMLAVGPGGKPRMYPGTKTGHLKNEPVVSLVNERGVFIRDPQCITCGDVDGDGDLDAFIGQYAATYQFGKLPTPYYDANDGHPAYFLINDGSGFFTDRTVESGLASKRNRRTYSASFVNLDSDDDLDLMVVSDFAGLDLYLNNGAGRFADVTDTLGEAHYSFGMSHALADFNGDGQLDIYMVGMGSTTARRLEGLGLGRNGFEGIQEARMKMGYGNRLLLGRGDGMFTQATYNDHVARTGWAWGCTPWDFDNDGDRDLYVANGFLSAKSAKDYCTEYWRHDIYYGEKKSETLMQMVFDKCHSGLGSEISWNGFEHNVLLLNSPENNFPSCGFLMGVGFEFDSRAVVSADLDLDGRADLLVVERIRDEKLKAYTNRVHLMQNNLVSQNNWIGFHFSPKDRPFGLTVSLKSGQKTQLLPVVSGDSYNSQHPLSICFGLGKESLVSRVVLNWQSGEKQLIENPKIEEYHVILRKK